MRIHHLNCGTQCPLGGGMMDGFTKGSGGSRLVGHCLLIESEAGLALVDTGLGRDVEELRERLAGFFRTLHRPRLHVAETAVRQIEALGLYPADVRHILITHLDYDHAGAIEDLPEAQVHVYAAELGAAQERRGFIAKRRYRPQQWDGGVRWVRDRPGGEHWFGFECVRDLKGLPPEILIVPLIGHTFGHSGIAVQTAGGWLLNAGDGYFYRGRWTRQSTAAHPACASTRR